MFFSTWVSNSLPSSLVLPFVCLNFDIEALNEFVEKKIQFGQNFERKI